MAPVPGHTFGTLSRNAMTASVHIAFAMLCHLHFSKAQQPIPSSPPSTDTSINASTISTSNLPTTTPGTTLVVIQPTTLRPNVTVLTNVSTTPVTGTTGIPTNVPPALPQTTAITVPSTIATINITAPLSNSTMLVSMPPTTLSTGNTSTTIMTLLTTITTPRMNTSTDISNTTTTTLRPPVPSNVTLTMQSAAPTISLQTTTIMTRIPTNLTGPDFTILTPQPGVPIPAFTTPTLPTTSRPTIPNMPPSIIPIPTLPSSTPVPSILPPIVVTTITTIRPTIPNIPPTIVPLPTLPPLTPVPSTFPPVFPSITIPTVPPPIVTISTVPPPIVTIPTIPPPIVTITTIPQSVLPTITIPTIPPPLLPTIIIPTIRPPVLPTVITPSVPPLVLPTITIPTIPPPLLPTNIIPTIRPPVLPTVIIPTIPPPLLPTITIPTIPPPVLPTISIPTIPPPIILPTTPTVDYVCVPNGSCNLPPNSIGIDVRITSNLICPVSQTACPRNLVSNNQCGVRFIQNHHTNDGPVAQGAYPWQIFLRNQTEFIGSGILVDPLHIVTAAHKVYYSRNNPQSITALLGVHDPLILINVQTRMGVRIMIHSGFNIKTLRHDIAVIRLNSPVLATNNIGFACLPALNQVFTGRSCMVSGWGETQFSIRDSPTRSLKQIAVPIVSYEICRASLLNPTVLGSNTDVYLDPLGQICAGGEENRDVCTQDGGSPLSCEDPVTRRTIVAGLVIWGKQCKRRGVYGVYINLSYYITWINNVIATLNAISG